MMSIRSALALAALIGLAGCATTDDLYAQYDDLCPVAITALPEGGVAVVGALRTDVWEQAVYFGFDRDQLDADGEQRLAHNLAVLKHYPTLRVSIQAFTDQLGSDDYNRALASRRQAAVVSYLTGQGISRQRLQVAAPAKAAPLEPGTGIEERILNRRVEMMPLDANGRPLVLRVDFTESGGDAFAAPLPVQ